MATVKMKDAEKAALQNELKFYTNLLENHERKMQAMKSVSTKGNLPVLSGVVTRNEISTQNLLKSPTNHFSSTKLTECLNIASTNIVHKGFNECNTTFLKQRVFPKNSNIKYNATLCKSMSLQNQLKRCPYNYDSGKSNKYIKLHTPGNKPVNNFQRSLQLNPFSIKDNPVCQKHFNPISKYNPSQKLVDEIKVLTEQLKQKSKSILPSKKTDYGINLPSKRTNYGIINLPSKKTEYGMINLSSKNQLNFQSSTKVTAQHKRDVYKKENSFQKVCIVKVLHENVKELSNSEANIFKSIFVPSKLLTNSNLPLNDNVKSPKINLIDSVNVSSMQPQPVVENKKKLDYNLNKPVHKMFLNSVNSIKKSPKLSQDNCLKTPVKSRLIKKHSNSIKKVGAKTKLLSSQYKVINKKSCVQVATCENPILKSSKNTAKFNKLNNSKIKWTNAKFKANANKTIAETSKLNSKYEIINKVNKIEVLPESSVNKNITKLSIASSYPNVCNSIPSYSRRNSVIRKVLTPMKPSYRGINKNISHSRLKSSARFSFKKSVNLKKIHSQSSNSKYRVVNKSSSSANKISKRKIIRSNKLPDVHNSSMDLDLLLELAAEKHKSVDDKFSPSKQLLTRRIYKSENAIVNKTSHSAQDKAVKMIKSKYSTINKHLWRRQTVPKKFSPGRFYNGNRFNTSFRRRKILTSHYNQKNKCYFFNSKTGVHNPSYYTRRNCRRKYVASRNKYAFAPSGSFRSPNSYKRNTTYPKVFKTPTRSKLTVPISQTLASRVLHRSINRALTASKRASKRNQYCMFYNRFGRCNKGVKCPFVHDPKKIAVCTRFLRGTCKTKNCPFSHEICPGKMAICSFFLLGSCTKIDCPYRHETLSPDAKLCKAFVQGYCPKGRECKQAHILICPQFIQGNCPKGNACAFPHPPPKERKNVPKTIEKNENIKAIEENENPKEIEEVLMEKMSRYFEPLCEQITVEKSCINNLVARRIQSLPEQPEYIAFSLSDSET